MEEKEILVKVVELFMRFGIKSMTMDEIARQLGISKKTLYQFVSNKNELVEKAVALKITEEQDCICQLFQPKGNAIDELMEMTTFVGANMKEMHPSVIFDMKKYHFDAWKKLNNHKESFIYETILNNLKKGVESGLYRDNLIPEIVAKFYLCMVNTIIDPANWSSASEMDRPTVYEQMMRYHIRGIANDKGRAYLKEKFNQNNL